MNGMLLTGRKELREEILAAIAERRSRDEQRVKDLRHAGFMQDKCLQISEADASALERGAAGLAKAEAWRVKRYGTNWWRPGGPSPEAMAEARYEAWKRGEDV